MDLQNIIQRAMQIVRPEDYKDELQQRIDEARETFINYCVEHKYSRYLAGLARGEIADYIIMKCAQHIRDEDHNWILRREAFDYLSDGSKNTDRWRFTYIPAPKPTPPPVPPPTPAKQTEEDPLA